MGENITRLKSVWSLHFKKYNHINGGNYLIFMCVKYDVCRCADFLEMKIK